MNLHLALTPLISLLAGVLILVMPKLLNLIVAIYLITVGLIGLFGAGTLRLNPLAVAALRMVIDIWGLRRETWRSKSWHWEVCTSPEACPLACFDNCRTAASCKPLRPRAALPR